MELLAVLWITVMVSSKLKITTFSFVFLLLQYPCTSIPALKLPQQAGTPKKKRWSKAVQLHRHSRKTLDQMNQQVKMFRISLSLLNQGDTVEISIEKHTEKLTTKQKKRS